MSHAMTSGPASLLLLLSLLAVASASAAEMKPPAKGDRIVFLGDSITQGGAGPNGQITAAGDRVHLNGTGNKFVAKTMLKTLNR